MVDLTYSGATFVPTQHNDIYEAIDPTKTDLSQPNKVVLITGAGRGIGRSIALSYARCGVAAIVICARTASELDEVEQAITQINSTIRVHKHTLDVSDTAQVQGVADAVRAAEHGRLDVLVNNAGTSSPWLPIAESDPEAYWNTLEVNLKGPYLLMKFCLPLLVDTAKQQGTLVDVVNVSSVGAKVIMPTASSYQVSKHALCRLSEFAAAEVGPQGVTCISIHPGGVMTALGSRSPEYIRSLLKDTPELAGGFVAWFTKGQRAWANGRYLSVNWDVDELLAKKDEIVAENKLTTRMAL